MADESPPPKKIGSLRDRIAAFEKQSSNTPSHPPPTRPKPGNVSWKPQQTSSPPSPSNKDKERDPSAKSSMSAADAKESIGQGISLRERMAVLQSAGGFGPANPPPKPTTEKPKWKPPPKPISPPSPSGEKAPVDFESVIRSPPSNTESTETPTEEPTESAEQGDEGSEDKADPEEEERQRRAAIAARMQRLGGARIGMAPVIPQKPPFRRTSVQKEEEIKPEISSPPPVAEDQSKERGEVQPEDSEDKPAETASTSNKPPTSMPVPSAPRRAAPPRRKKETPKPSEEPSTEEAPIVSEAQVPLPESTSNLLSDAEEENTEVPSDADSKPVVAPEPPLLAKEESPELAEDQGLVTERSPSPNIGKSGDGEDVPEEVDVPCPPKEGQAATTLSREKLAELVEEGQKEIEERSGIDQPEQGLEEPLAEVLKDEEPSKLGETAEGEDERRALTEEQDAVEDKPKDQPEEEEDEATRRASITTRHSSGFNPFTGDPPVRKPSSGSIPDRRTSVETPEPFKPAVQEEPEPAVQSIRDDDSFHSLPTPEATEEDKPFDTLKRIEDNNWNPDESEGADSEGVPGTGNSMDVEPAKVSSLLSFAVPQPPPLTPRPAPPAQPVPDSTILVKIPAPKSLPHASSSLLLPPRSSEENPDILKEGPDSPDGNGGGRPSFMIPPPPTVPRPLPSRPNAESRKSLEAASHESDEYEEEPSTTSFDFTRYTDTASHPQVITGRQGPPETEILADEDGDPIDPGFIPSRSPSIKAAKSPVEPPRPPQEQSVRETEPEEEDQEQARKRRLAERMAKLGGIRFGVPPPIGIPPPPKVERETKEEGGERPKGDEPEEEDEQARRQRIAAKLAGMGGMRIGMVPGVVPPPKPPAPTRKDSVRTKQSGQKSPPPPVRAPPAPTLVPPPPVRSDTGNASEDDVVKVEFEESEAEEVDYHHVSEEVPPPIPSRTTRPPIPGSGHHRKASSDSILFPTHGAAPSRVAPPAHSEYVMVEEPDIIEVSTPLPPPRATRPPRAAPPPPAPSSDVPDDMTMSQWELPPIPRSSLDMEASAADLSASSWSETFDGEETPQEKTTESSSKERRQSAGQMTMDQLMTVWGRVGVQVCEVAVQLFEKSRKSLIGDGTHIGFLNAVLERVPNASMVEEDASSFGYLIYAQTGALVTKRAADIMPGDVIVLQEAKLKGHKGLQTYQQTVGGGAPVVAVIGEYEAKRSKVRVYQASQHVGSQTVETVSYRLEDLKSGSIKVFRVLES